MDLTSLMLAGSLFVIMLGGWLLLRRRRSPARSGQSTGKHALRREATPKQVAGAATGQSEPPAESAESVAVTPDEPKQAAPEQPTATEESEQPETTTAVPEQRSAAEFAEAPSEHSYLFARRYATRFNRSRQRIARVREQLNEK